MFDSKLLLNHEINNHITINQNNGYCNLYMLDGRKDENAQLFIELIKTQYLRETGTRLEDMLLPVCFHQSPISCQAEIAYCIKSILCFFVTFYKKSSLLENFYLLLEREKLFSISHKGIYKKCPALVRYIPCGREAAAGSIVCKGTTLNRNFQMI